MGYFVANNNKNIGIDFENVVLSELSSEINLAGLSDVNVINGSRLEHDYYITSIEMMVLKQNLMTGNKYLTFPDSDLIIYNTRTSHVHSIISCKRSLRDRYTQSLFWATKLRHNRKTAHVKYYIVSEDERIPIKKGSKSYNLIMDDNVDGLFIRDNGKIEYNDIIMPYEKMSKVIVDNLFSQQKVTCNNSVDKL